MNLINRTLKELPEHEQSRLLNIVANDLFIDSEIINWPRYSNTYPNIVEN